MKKYVLISFILSIVLFMLLSLVQIRADALKLKKLLIEDFIGVMDLNLVILMLVSMISRELRIPPLSAVCAISQLRCFRNWKNLSCIIIYLTNNIHTMPHYSWTKESKTLDKKLNGKHVK